jgi:hypothetical protein
VAERVEALLADMTVEEKAGQLTQYFYFDLPPSEDAEATLHLNFSEQPAMVEAASSAAAALPLSKATIARTIHKIGYSCGQVASTSPVDGQAGAFTVTCTSGQSYRASQVRGRYRFKRL